MQSDEQRAFQAGYDAYNNNLLGDRLTQSRDNWLWIAYCWEAGYAQARLDGQSLRNTVASIFYDTFINPEPDSGEWD